MLIKVSDESIREVLDIVRTMIEKFGPRVAGTEACRKSAIEIERKLKPSCDAVVREPFRLYPGSMWNLGFMIGGCYCIATLLMLLGGSWVWGAAAAATLSIIYWLCQSVFMFGTFDFLFRAYKGLNVWGRIEPTGDVRQQIYIVGHHDSPRILTFLNRWQKLYSVRIIGAIVFSLAQLILAWCWAGWRARNGMDPAWADMARGVVLVGLVFLMPLIFFIGRKGSPGAGDNLVACAMGIKIAEIIHGKKNDEHLAHTRLVVLSVDGEEIGMRGSAEFVREHRDELTRIKTYVINFDAIYQIEDIRLITRDRNGMLPLSAEMLFECQEITEQLGYEIAQGPVTFGGGGTDAVQFARADIDVASIIGISTKLIREGLVYHTTKDTVDCLDPRAIKACMEIALNYIVKKDRECVGL